MENYNTAKVPMDPIQEGKEQILNILDRFTHKEAADLLAGCASALIRMSESRLNDFEGQLNEVRMSHEEVCKILN